MGRLTPELNNALAALRREAGLTQGELARAADVSRQTISSIEQGAYNPSTSLTLRLSVVLGFPVERLFSLPDPAVRDLVHRREELKKEHEVDAEHAHDS